MTQSQVNRVIVVSAKEHGKIEYLLSSIVMMDEAYQDFKAWRTDVAFGQGVTTYARIDWRQVANYCAPQVLVVIIHDRNGTEFEDFPLYAVLPESRQVVLLHDVGSITVEASDDARAEVNVKATLNSLTTYVQSVDGRKKENAMRQLQILQRILR